jgi:hypothetical protein
MIVAFYHNNKHNYTPYTAYTHIYSYDAYIFYHTDTEAELPPQALQLLCGCLDDLAEEGEPGTRYRRLATALRILRAFGGPAITLASELGFGDIPLLMTGVLGENEKAALAELGRLLA